MELKLKRLRRLRMAVSDRNGFRISIAELSKASGVTKGQIRLAEKRKRISAFKAKSLIGALNAMPPHSGYIILDDEQY